MNPNSEDMYPPHTGIINGVNEKQNIDKDRILDESKQNMQPPDDRQTHSTGYTMVPPNESRRSKLQRMSQKELEDLDRWKEEHRPGPIQLAPEKLGGSVSLAEVRQKQQMEASSSKLKKKLKKEEMDKMRRREEEEKNMMMKAVQREKADRLEIQKNQEEELRRELYQLDLHRIREEHLQRLERSSSVPMAASNSTLTSSWSRVHEHREARRAEDEAALQIQKEDQRRKAEILKEKQKQQEEVKEKRMESERLRVNSAFLDRLEARGSGRAAESPPPPQEGGNVWQAEEPQDPASSPGPFPSQVHSDSAKQEKEDADHDWAVMKLQNHFPYYERDLLEDIVSQCNGNYQQAYDLLNV